MVSKLVQHVRKGVHSVFCYSLLRKCKIQTSWTCIRVDLGTCRNGYFGMSGRVTRVRLIVVWVPVKQNIHLHWGRACTGILALAGAEETEPDEYLGIGYTVGCGELILKEGWVYCFSGG